MSDFDQHGDWRAERMYVLRTLDDVKTEQRRQAEVAAAERAALLEKAARDIAAAHDKIRRLEREGSSQQIKLWIASAALSGAFVVLFEVVKEWIHK
jgi:hypothetical protein